MVNGRYSGTVIIDVHCHYTLSAKRVCPNIERFSFEPAQEAAGAGYDTCIAPRAARRWAWSVVRRMLRVDSRLPIGEALDGELHAAAERHLLNSTGPIERFVLLAFDWYHDDSGRQPPLPQREGIEGSDIYTSNSLIRDLCRRHPQRYLFGASVHPYREHAVQCIDEVFSAGACLLKWLPLHQNINAADPRSRAVLRRCGELGLPVLAHYGEEFTLATQRREYIHVRQFLDALRDLRRDGHMPPAIVAHVSTPVMPWGDHSSTRMLIDALTGEFAQAPLYADISALTTLGKIPYLKSLARRQDLHHKLLFGSDWPVPPLSPMLRLLVGRDYSAVRGEPSWPQRVALLCQRMGFNEIVFQRAAEILPNVHFFSR
ncbi:MAG: amidohydrolase family protein [Phycisphaerales bacterium]|nr:amidohydrolase family protein [Phycisphaerales bacterium]